MLGTITGTWTFKMALASLGAALIGWGLIEVFHIHRNQERAREALKVIAEAESSVKGDDRDGNGMADYWTGDVACLGRGTPWGPAMGLVAAEIADADASPLKGPGIGAATARPQPFAGYYFVALRRDAAGAAYDEGHGRNWAKFGFAAYPASYPWNGVLTFFVNESNLIVSLDTRGRPPEAFPPDAPRR